MERVSGRQRKECMRACVCVQVSIHVCPNKHGKSPRTPCGPHNVIWLIKSAYLKCKKIINVDVRSRGRLRGLYSTKVLGKSPTMYKNVYVCMCICEECYYNQTGSHCC